MARRFHPHQELLPLVWVTKGKEPYSARLLPSPFESRNGERFVHVHWDEASYDAWVPASTVELASEGRRSNNRKRSDEDEASDGTAKEEANLEALKELIDLIADAERETAEESSSDDAVAEPVLSSKVSSSRAKPVQKNIFLHVSVTEHKEPYSARLLPVSSESIHGVRKVRVHWDEADYEAWVPAAKVEIVAEGRRSRKRAEEEDSEEVKEQRILKALSGLIDEMATEQERIMKLETAPMDCSNAEASSSSSTDETPLDTKMESKLLSPRRREASLLSDSLAEYSEPTFDIRGHRPRKVPARYARSPSLQEPARKPPPKPNTRKPPPKPDPKSSMKSRTGSSFKSSHKNRLSRRRSAVQGESRESVPWTDEEVGVLLKAVKRVGQPTNWNEVAALVPGRSYNSCSMKFLKLTNAKADRPLKLSREDKLASRRSTPQGESREGEPWTDEEIHCLFEAVKREGQPTDWDAVAACIPGRNANSCYLKHLRLKYDIGWTRPKKRAAPVSRDDCKPASRPTPSTAKKLRVEPESSVKPVRKNRWTQEEDDILRQKQAIFGSNFGLISQYLPLRSGKACESRFYWLNQQEGDTTEESDGQIQVASGASTFGGKIENKWSREEDAILLQKQAVHGNHWDLISQSLPLRSGSACKSRFSKLKSGDSTSKQSSSDWTQEEDAILREKQAMFGNKWRMIARYLPNRSNDDCRRRFKQLNPGHRSTMGGGVIRGLRTGSRFAIPNQMRELQFTKQDIWLIQNYVPKPSPYL